MSTVRRYWLPGFVALFGLACGMLEGRTAHAEDPPAPPALHPAFSGGLQPSNRHLVVEGQPVRGARVYEHYKHGGVKPRLNGLLVTGFPGYGAVFISMSGASVYRVRAEDIVQRDDGGRDILERAKETIEGGNHPMGKAKIERAEGKNDLYVFDVPSTTGGAAPLRCLLKPSPTLLGWHTQNEVILHHPAFGRDAMLYEPDAEAMKQLLALKGRFELHLFSGTWCPRCEEYMGRIIGVADTRVSAARQAGHTKLEIAVKYYGLPAPNDGLGADPEVVKHKLQKYPAGIIYKEGRVVARIEGTHWEKPARILVAMLTPHADK